MCWKTILLVTAILLVCSAVTSSALDGDRRGFVLGAGVGAGTMNVQNTVRVVGVYESSYDANGIGPSFRFEIGHAPSQQLMITWDTRISWINDSYSYQSSGGSRAVDEQILSFISGPSLVHFSKPASPSFFIGGGPAFAFASDETDFVIFGPPSRYLGGYGLALTAKSGYEFNRHFNVCFDFVLGFLSDDSEKRDANSTLFSLSATVNWLGY